MPFDFYFSNHFGCGSFLRFGEAGGSMEELDRIAITHLHTDHVADLPALLKERRSASAAWPQRPGSRPCCSRT